MKNGGGVNLVPPVAPQLGSNKEENKRPYYGSCCFDYPRFCSLIQVSVTIVSDCFIFKFEKSSQENLQVIFDQETNKEHFVMGYG